MSSLYDELSEKLNKDPRLVKRGGARYDLGLLLFNARDSLRELSAYFMPVRQYAHETAVTAQCAV